MQELHRCSPAGPGPSSMRSSMQYRTLRACSGSRGPLWCQHHSTGTAGPCSKHTQHTASIPGEAAAGRLRSSSSRISCCQQFPAATTQQQFPALATPTHSQLSPSAPRLPHRTHGCVRTMQRQSGKLTSRAGRLTPPSASLAFAEPATAVAGSAAGAAAAGMTTAAGGFGFSKVLAVVLGYCVMAGSLFRSVPQIIKVIQHNSTEGLSLMSYVVELCCYSVVIAYNLCQGYGFNTFGEVVACWIQDIILIALVFRDRRTPLWVVLIAAAAFMAGCSFLLSPSCPRQLLATMQASNIAVMALGSRLPQIVLNMRRGNAGMLSVTTCLLNVAGNAARIFTTIVLTGDLLMLGGACSQGCLNTILLYQSVSTARARRAAAAGTAAASAAPAASPGSSSLQQPKQQLQQQRQSPPEVTSSGPEGPPGGFPALQPAT